ncbi:MAG: hypothetical protein LBB88_10985 [Planctomycetaceae bacterium]|jgi:hypothetical protein|nr:hypothetical protein [Planctomycetaceae bacterium]
MSETNVALNELLTTENMDFSHRGTPLNPALPEHYVNKRYVDQSLSDVGVRSKASIILNCDGIAASYAVQHNLNTLNIATVQVYDTTSDSQLPIGVDWTPTDNNTITLQPDVIFPASMTLLVIVTA